MLAYYQRMTGFRPPRHLKLIARLLQSMEEDKVDRGMLFAPPRHIKTEMCSDLFPSWLMGRNPKSKIMSVVHTQRYAGKLGRKVRNRLLQTQYPFDTSLAEDSKAREQWATPEGGEYNGFGIIGGNQHGNPAEWLFMDDIVKGRKIALSPHMREEVWETYTADLVSRLQGRAKQLLAITRWNEDDPAGRILPEDFDGSTGWYRDRNTREPWFVLSLQAVCEHQNDPLGRKIGEYLWPERFGDRILGGRRKRGGWIWSSLYQQRPAPDEGLMFRSDMLQEFDLRTIDRTRLTIFGSSDYAVTEQKTESPDPDWTVHIVWGVDSDFNIYLLDMWRGRTTPDVWVEAFVRLIKRHKPLRWFEENGQIIKSVGPLIKLECNKERAYTDRVQLSSTTDKEQRAQALLGLAAAGKLYLPMRHNVEPYLLDCIDAFVKELLQFPAGRHDDCVDAGTLFGRGVDKMIGGRRPPKKAPHITTLDDLFRENEERDADDE
ncbi:MAG: phage terminase large subunit [Pseudomonadota bacterium]